jgi:hypothetical protein
MTQGPQKNQARIVVVPPPASRRPLAIRPVVSAISVISVALLPGGWGRKEAAPQNSELQDSQRITEPSIVEA